MQTLTRAHHELFRRAPDERFRSFAALLDHCQEQRTSSIDRWELPHSLRPSATADRLQLAIGGDEGFSMNDWSFGQLCRMAGVKKGTVNRLSPDTAKRVFYEMLPVGNKPLQLLTDSRKVRSIHSASYTRVHNADLLEVVQDFATDFRPPPVSGSGATGLYCGEQDMFCFMIDPSGWTEIDGQAFAPGYFVWNSEVGRRSIGIQTFWFQSVCANHIVWDAIEVADFSRKHTANVQDAIGKIRNILEALVESRNQRRDGFVKVVRRAMSTKLGTVADDVALELARNGITKTVANQALEIAEREGNFTIFALVDALTRLAGQVDNAGDRVEADQLAACLLSLAA